MAIRNEPNGRYGPQYFDHYDYAFALDRLPYCRREARSLTSRVTIARRLRMDALTGIHEMDTHRVPQSIRTEPCCVLICVLQYRLQDDRVGGKSRQQLGS